MAMGCEVLAHVLFSQVWAVDSVPNRLAMAASFGAATLDFTACDVLAAVRKGTEGRGADVALEVQPLTKQLDRGKQSDCGKKSNCGRV